VYYDNAGSNYIDHVNLCIEVDNVNRNIKTIGGNESGTISRSNWHSMDHVGLKGYGQIKRVVRPIEAVKPTTTTETPT